MERGTLRNSYEIEWDRAEDLAEIRRELERNLDYARSQLPDNSDAFDHADYVGELLEAGDIAGAEEELTALFNEHVR